jgi:protocatechuate 3,4-dioxygenase beta subunit
VPGCAAMPASSPPSATAAPTASPTAELTTSTPPTAAAEDCAVRPELSQGPYFRDGAPERSDVRTDPTTGAVCEGVPLELSFVVSVRRGDACTPLEGARVDIWHCDALGVYSGTSAPGRDTTGQMYLRGYQVTDASGRASFTTIYPGWYPGRAVHIHFKIRGNGPDGRRYEFTSQLFFNEAITDEVHGQEPYASRGRRNRMNTDDGIYLRGGEQTLLTPVKTESGFSARFAVALPL